MASIRLSDLYDRAGQIRSDLLPAQISGALVSAAQKLAVDTGLLEDVIPFTLPEGLCTFLVELPAGRSVQAVKRVESMDEDGKWLAMDGPALSILGRTPPESMDPGTPTKWITTGNDLLMLNCPTDADLALRVTVAYIPGKADTPDQIDFPPEAGDALVAQARSYLWAIAGQGQNLKMEAVDARSYRNELPRLCHLADVGHGRVRQSINDALPME